MEQIAKYTRTMEFETYLYDNDEEYFRHRKSMEALGFSKSNYKTIDRKIRVTYIKSNDI